MIRRASLAFALATLAAPAAAQQPSIQNGRVETRKASSIDREIAAIASGAAEPVWIGWRVPMVDGERNLCCSYYNDQLYPSGIRGCFVEQPSITTMDGLSASNLARVPNVAPPTGPVSLEAGTGLVMLVRVIDKQVERVRALGDDCPLDAGGRTVYWLEGVTPADSLAFLDGLAHRADVSADLHRRMAESAVSAIALHRDNGADAILDRLATSDPESSVRRQAAAALGSSRGAHGLTMLQQLIAAEKTPDVRRQFVTSLGQTRQPGTVAALRSLTRDADPKIRAEAIYWFAVRGGASVTAEVTAAIESDQDDSVKRRGVSGFTQLPDDQRIPVLIALARTSASHVVRKDAVTALSRLKDPRALAFLREIVSK